MASVAGHVMLAAAGVVSWLVVAAGLYCLIQLRRPLQVPRNQEKLNETRINRTKLNYPQTPVTTGSPTPYTLILNPKP